MFISNARIVLENRVIDKGIIEINDGIISSIYESNEIKGLDIKGNTVFPGFIDAHIHGVSGVDFMDSSEDLNIILNSTLKEGTTSLLATTMTQKLEVIMKSLKNISETKSTGSKILGVHLEGPFLNKKFKGAQNEELILKGSIEEFEKLNDACNGMIKIVTLAPEMQDEEFLKYLSLKGIVMSMGHSNASSDDVENAMKYGCMRVTHGFNAMSKFHHRDIGLVGSMLLHDDIFVEVIADLHHSSKEALALLKKIKPSHKISLITDSIRAKGMSDGVYDLGGTDVTVKDKMAYIGDVIAGSTLAYNVGLKNFKDSTDCSLIDLGLMSSTNQALELGLTNLGKIKEGYIADLTIVDNEFNVLYTIIDGEIRYKRG